MGRTPPANPQLLQELLEVLHQCRRDIAQADTEETDWEEEEEDSDDWEADEG